ncbi:uncharacterized protein SPPG_06640 [Spizellomyces punctatus DAOM BR117]|uniref:Trafficking protein particle complex subunit 11 domain-containing protein n=1 Tax=Spizellomyces punctatus (strain DAOM BR117) TaxID=645134 RepID=A0A0L0H9L1_SPIPD|nr:uncharacterized protein SPPG_06640 [Spizellomyces punctatus DAOM BR117]KNC98240.1 hypothetical protein SPPG_06640 [Spizellomyces punctatus DAOM BR117]|eukprot:XP_016606280.1 hypothetical protein SPPG_06640 [Spizellomyces punctatus DAOM BR117]
MANGRDFICRLLSPLVAVVATSDAEELAKLNNLPTFADFIKPFGTRIKQVHVQDSQGHASILESFSVRFRDWRQLDQFNPQIINKTVVDHLGKHGRRRPTFPSIKTKEDVQSAYSQIDNDQLTPWYSDYRNSVCKYVGFSEHETFNHPVAYLVVVSTSNPNPADAAQDLTSDSQFTTLSEKSFLDPAIPKYYILVHDAHVAPGVDPEAALVQMRKSLPATYLLRINSVVHSPPSNSDPFNPETIPSPTVPDVWTSIQSETIPLLEQLAASLKSTSTASLASTRDSISSPIIDEGFPLFKEKGEPAADPLGASSTAAADSPTETKSPAYGCYLTNDDFAGIDECVKDLVVQKIIKHMESCIQHWNEQVASNRRGLTGRLNRLVGLKYFGGGTKSQAATPAPVTDKSGVTVFPHNAPEMIMRRLADFAFMLEDYRLAFGTYDSIRKDFQGNERFVKFHAGTQEMLGLTVLMGDGIGRGSVENYLETAVTGYQDSKVPLYAARAAMLYYEMLRERGLFREAAPLLIRMTGEDSDVRSALFLEQAAISFLRVNPPMIRKYAFHMILAGHRFAKCGQRLHAYRSYMSALDVYEERDWSLVEDHIHFILGRQCFHLGEFEAAVKFFLKLLRASRQTAAQQSSYLREFLYLFKQYAAKASKDDLRNLPPLPVPEFNLSSILVSMIESHSGQPKQVANSDEAWDTMENELFEEGYSKVGPRAFRTANNRGKTTCAVGEPVFVAFEIHNPMNIPVQINNVSLQCAYRDKPPAPIDLTWNADTQAPETIELEEFDVQNTSEIELDGNERKRVQLQIFPKREGEVRITGVRYTLCGVVPSCYTFPASRPGKNDPVSQLTLTVTSPMPVLDVILHSFPISMLSGEVVRAVLEINNKGNRGLRNLQLKTSHPTFFCVGESDAMDCPSYVPTDNGTNTCESLKIRNLLSNLGTIPIKLPASDRPDQDIDGVLAPGTTTIIPLWIRGDKVGKQNFRFLFGYQSEDKSDKVGCRTLRISMATNILPSVRMNAFTRPSGRVLDEFILGVEIENLHGEGELVLKQITSMSPTWIIRPIDDRLPVEEDSKLQAQQTRFKYLRFTKATGPLEPTNLAKVPERITMRAIESLLLGESPVNLDAPDLTLRLSNLALSPTHNVLSCDTVPFRGLSLNSRLQWRVSQLLAQYPGLTLSQLRHLFTLYFTDDVDLSLIWETSDGTKCGHHYIMGINLGLQAPLQGLQAGLEPLAAAAKAAAGRALFETTVREKRALITSLLKPRGKDVSPLRVILKSELEYRHDFGKQEICSVPITLTIRNTAWANVANFTLQTAIPDTTVVGQTDIPALDAPGFYWLGATCSEGRLQPEEETSVTFTACFRRPGVYNVNRWQMNISIDPPHSGTEDKKGVASAGVKEGTASYVQMPNLPHWVTVLG